MLLWTNLLCLFSANLVASQFLPEVFGGYDPRKVLQPLNNGLETKGTSDNVRVIRALLAVRQSECPAGYAECTSRPGRCCPTGGSCCQSDGCCRSGYYCYSTGCCQTGYSGCEGNSCCAPSESCCSGGGCCRSGYYCAVVDGERGCCPNGSTCTGDTPPPQCTNPNYVLCPGENFCCPAGYECYRDASNAPLCRDPSSPPNTSVNTDPPTATYIPPVSTPTVTTTTTTRRPSTILLPSTTSTPTPTPTSDDSSDGSGATSSAVSVAVNALLTWFTGVGVFAFLF